MTAAIEKNGFRPNGAEFSNNSPYLRISEEAREKSVPTFKDIVREGTGSVLSSLQRLSRLYNMHPGEVGIQRADDVLFELSGNANNKETKDNSDALKKHLSKIQELCCIYYPFAEYVAGRAGATVFFDLEEVIDIAQFVVDKTVWENFSISSDNPERLAELLSRKIKGNLAHLRNVVEKVYKTGSCFGGNVTVGSYDEPRYRDENEGSFQDKSLAFAWYDREEDKISFVHATADGYINRFAGKQIPTDDAMQNIILIAQQLKLPEFMTLVQKIGVREQIALLAYLGYFGIDDNTLASIAKRLNLKQETLKLALWSASKKLDRLYSSSQNMTALGTMMKVHPERPITPLELASKLCQSQVPRSSGRIIPFDSSRVGLMEGLENPDVLKHFLDRLTPKEIELLDLVLYKEKDGSYLPFSAIAEKLGMQKKSIPKAVQRLLNMLTNDDNQPRYITTSGNTLRKDNSQFLLINIRERIPKNPSLTSILTDQQYKIFIALTSITDSGRYADQSEVLKEYNTTSSNFIPELLRKLSNPKLLTELDNFFTKVKYVINDTNGNFTDKEKEIAQYFFDKIKNGLPIWGPKGGIGYTAAATDLKTTAFKIHYLFSTKTHPSIEQSSKTTNT